MDNSYVRKKFEITEYKGFAEIIISYGENNYIDDEFLVEIETLITGIEQNNNIQCVFFRSGIQGIFSRGLNLALFKNKSESERRLFVEKAKNVLNRLENLPVLSVGLIDGKCMGAGLEFILACDIRVASARSQFASPEIVYGLIPGGGMIQRLVRLIGKGEAMLMLFSGTIINAAKSQAIGLVQEIVEDDVGEWGRQFGNRIRRMDHSCIVQLKKAVRFGLEHTYCESIENDFKIASDFLSER